ncbi:MAG: O-antigen ligase family protein [Thiobacillus sp.]|nr:O-antigen ligase family protein [Thiobacillus sp.]
MLNALTDRASRSFLRWGWLLPAFFPLAQILGRGVFNSLSGLYFLWALLALPGLRAGLGSAGREPFFILYALLLVIWSVSLTVAADPAKGMETLARYLQYSLAGLFTFLALRQVADGPVRLLRMLSLGALLSIAVLYVQLPYFYWATEFDPTQQLREDNLPWLLPFVLAALGLSKQPRWLAAGTILIFAFYIMVSQGRAALAGLIAGLALFGALAYGIRKRYLAGIAVAGLVTGALLSERFFRGLTGFRLDFATLDRFSSGRATIWMQALTSPPDNPWLGVGLGNVTSHWQVLQIGHFAVKHLHNFVFDAWFETGYLGLLALSALFGAGYAAIIRAWTHLTTPHRQIAAAAIAASVAILVAGLFSYSYTSRQFALYLYVLFALMLDLARRTPR